jgi:DeoR/GlpR family transcriptional regulator of sugar metabolism
MLEPEDLGPADEKMLDLLKQGRVTAPYAAEETDYSLQYARETLKRLVEHGHALKVHTGLYEFVNDPREDGDA